MTTSSARVPRRSIKETDTKVGNVPEPATLSVATVGKIGKGKN